MAGAVGRLALLVALLAAAALGACGGESDGAERPGTQLAVPWLDPDGEFPIVGSLGVNPADGRLWMATNTGLFRRLDRRRAAGLVAADPTTFYALLLDGTVTGSADGGRTWSVHVAPSAGAAR